MTIYDITQRELIELEIAMAACAVLILVGACISFFRPKRCKHGLTNCFECGVYNGRKQP